MQKNNLPEFKSDEEFGQFVLENDLSPYLESAKRAEFPDLKLSGHFIPLALENEEFHRLSKSAAEKGESIADLVSQIFHRGLKEWQSRSGIGE